MPDPVTIAALLAAGGALYIVNKNNTNLNSSIVNKSKPPHLIAGANLLTDQQIAQMEYNTIKDRANKTFVPTLLQYCLPQEIIADPTIMKCASGGHSPQGPPLAITVGKDGQLALGAAAGIGGVAGGTFGSAAGFAGTGFAASGTALGTAIPIAGIVIGPALAIFSAILAHHKAAVGREQQLECTLVPPANQALQVIEQAVITGQITVDQANKMLNQLYNDFVTEATGGLGGLKDAPGSLNAMGYYKHFLHAIIIKKQNRYASLTY